MHSTVKLLGLMSVAVALGFGIVRVHRASESSAADSMRASVAKPASAACAAAEAASAGTDTATQAAARELAALRQEVAHLREEVAALAAADKAGPADSAAQPLADLRRQVAALQKECASKEQASDPPSRAEAERYRQAEMEAVEAGFRQEPADRRWADRTSTAVVDALDSSDLGDVVLAVLSLECRSRTCRVELTDDDTGKSAKELPTFLQRVAETFPSITVNQAEHPDGSRSSILYMTGDPREQAR